MENTAGGEAYCAIYPGNLTNKSHYGFFDGR